MVESYFAPAERLDNKRVSAQRTAVRKAVSLEALLSSLDSMVLVLNRQRQIIENFAPASTDDRMNDALGLRPGEFLGCVHASDHPGGCGTSRGCRYCGVVQAIQECIEDQLPVKRVCSLRLTPQGESLREEGGEYQVNAVPFRLEEELFVLLLFENRSHEQRRRVMERLFFHDVLNTATGLRMYLELLSRRSLGDEVEDEVRRILSISQMLIDEIDDQKVLAGAENGTLGVRRDFIHSLEFLESLESQYSAMAAKRGVTLESASFSEAFLLMSDASLLRRVVGNMVKNAIEASGEGERVVIGCSEEAGRRSFSVRNPAVLSEEVRERLFTRSFSTKGENRGLGTYSMKLFGEGYLGGAVRCSSSPSDGTHFSITFPAGEPFDSFGSDV